MWRDPAPQGGWGTDATHALALTPAGLLRAPEKLSGQAARGKPPLFRGVVRWRHRAVRTHQPS
ncbi:hypothetical protein GCM10010404_75740 [Nonomuraea africana]